MPESGQNLVERSLDATVACKEDLAGMEDDERIQPVVVGPDHLVSRKGGFDMECAVDHDSVVQHAHYLSFHQSLLHLQAWEDEKAGLSQGAQQKTLLRLLAVAELVQLQAVWEAEVGLLVGVGPSSRMTD